MFQTNSVMIPFDYEKYLTGSYDVVTADKYPVTNVRLTESRNNPLRGTLDGQNTGWKKDGIYTIYGIEFPSMKLFLIEKELKESNNSES